jgi:hypothetical protein
LKNFIDNFYYRVKETQERLEKGTSHTFTIIIHIDHYQCNKISEYENELRILKDWNSFILVNMNKANIMDNYENTVVSIEKYLICELAKYYEIEDINIYFTYDYRYLMKVRNNAEVIQEEISEDLANELKSHLSVLYNHEMDHYFNITNEVSQTDKAQFIVKIEYKIVQEGVIASNTLQILSNVFHQTLSYFLSLIFKDDLLYSPTEIFKILLHRKSKEWNSIPPEERNQIMKNSENLSRGLIYLEYFSKNIPLKIAFRAIKSFTLTNKRSKCLLNLSKLVSIIKQRDAFQEWVRVLHIWNKK